MAAFNFFLDFVNFCINGFEEKTKIMYILSVKRRAPKSTKPYF